MSSTSVVGRDPETGLGLEIEISNGFISAVKNTAHSQGSYLSAGLIDLQVNGFKAIDLNDGGLDAGRVVAFTHMMHSLGTTTFLPTLITASAESLT
jgi:N-acetylglucosamine-6-phosphate deacetylase